MTAEAPDVADFALTRDAYLGGRLSLWQPATGYRAGVDPVLLASACPARAGESVLELGCGVGTASLCLAIRVPGLALAGVERQTEIAGIARRNARETGIALEVVTADIAALPTELRQRSFDHVIANPPYFRRRDAARSSHRAREAAMGEETPLATWLAVAARRLRSRGWLTLIQRPERLADMLAAAEGFGSVEIQPLQPRLGRPASLVLLRMRKGGRAPLILHAPLVMHSGPRHERDGEDYAPEIAAVLRHAAPLPGFGFGDP